MAWRKRSTIVSSSEQAASARGIVESEETAIECGFAFDSYLAQMFASERAPRKDFEYAMQASEKAAQTMIQGKPTTQARTDLDRAAATLLRKYGASHA